MIKSTHLFFKWQILTPNFDDFLCLAFFSVSRMQQHVAISEMLQSDQEWECGNYKIQSRQYLFSRTASSSGD